MADIQGTNVASGITPFTTEDTFPTHYSEYGKGGWREVETEADLSNISQDRLSYGMAVSVTSTQKIYLYYPDGWVEFKTSGEVWSSMSDRLSNKGD